MVVLKTELGNSDHLNKIDFKKMKRGLTIKESLDAVLKRMKQEYQIKICKSGDNFIGAHLLQPDYQTNITDFYIFIYIILFIKYYIIVKRLI